MKNKVKEMEDEAEKLRKIQEQVEEQMGASGEQTVVVGSRYLNQLWTFLLKA